MDVMLHGQCFLKKRLRDFASDEDFYTVGQVARLFGISPTSVKKWMRKGYLVGKQKERVSGGGFYWVFSKVEINALVAKQNTAVYTVSA